MAADEPQDRFTIDDATRLRGALRLAFFLSGQRVSLRGGDLPEAQSQAIESRLDRWQSVCGCGLAAVALLLGSLFGFLQHRGTVAIIVTGVLCAMAAKCVAIAVAYLAYRQELARTVGRFR